MVDEAKRKRLERETGHEITIKRRLVPMPPAPKTAAEAETQADLVRSLAMANQVEWRKHWQPQPNPLTVLVTGLLCFAAGLACGLVMS